MIKITLALVALSICLLAGNTENNPAPKQPNVKEKALFVNKNHYDAYLTKRAEQENIKKKKDLKIYKRKDGTIDTLKTINSANQ